MTKLILTFKIHKNFSIRATQHSLDRMASRKIEATTAAASIIALGEERLLKAQASNEDVMVLDSINNIAVVFAFDGNKILIITVIDKANCFVKSGTRIEKL